MIGLDPQLNPEVPPYETIVQQAEADWQAMFAELERLIAVARADYWMLPHMGHPSSTDLIPSHSERYDRWIPPKTGPEGCDVCAKAERSRRYQA